MKRNQQELAEIILRDPNVEAFMSSVGASGSRVGSNSGFLFMKLRPRKERKLTADQIIQELRPKLMGVPGISSSCRIPRPSSSNTTRAKAQYQFVLQSPETEELSPPGRRLRDEAAPAAHASGRHQRPGDQEPAARPGHRPGSGRGPGDHGRADRGHPLSRLRHPPGLHHLCPDQSVPGDDGAGAALPEGPLGPAGCSTCVPPAASWCRSPPSAPFSPAWGRCRSTIWARSPRSPSPST